MVLRVGRIDKISFKVSPSKINKIKESIKKEFANEYKIYIKKDEIIVSGDFSNYKKRNKIIYLLSGGKIGENVQRNSN